MLPDTTIKASEKSEAFIVVVTFTNNFLVAIAPSLS